MTRFLFLDDGIELGRRKRDSLGREGFVAQEMEDLFGDGLRCEKTVIVTGVFDNHVLAIGKTGSDFFRVADGRAAIERAAEEKSGDVRMKRPPEILPQVRRTPSLAKSKQIAIDRVAEKGLLRLLP